MNRKVYANLLSTYGRRVGVWCGFILELLRAVMGRVISVIILAQIASAVARQDFTSAQHSIVLWAVLTFIANILSSFGELCAHRAENREYGRLGMIFYKKLANKDLFPAHSKHPLKEFYARFDAKAEVFFDKVDDRFETSYSILDHYKPSQLQDFEKNLNDLIDIQNNEDEFPKIHVRHDNYRLLLGPKSYHYKPN